jgi:predicted HicB family RNase H-like nuclease
MPMKPFLLRLPVEVHRRLKVMAAAQEVSMKAFLIAKILEAETKVDVRGALAPADSTPVHVP